MPTARRVILLGASGSIGQSTLEVLEDLGQRGERSFTLVAAAVRRNVAALGDIALSHPLEAVAIADAPSAQAPPTEVRGADGRSLPVLRGARAAVDLVDSVGKPGDLVVAAMVGAAGIEPVLAAIARGCDVALANKETLVAAGELVMAAARQRGVRIIPVDSEHSAIAQCLQGLPRGAHDVARIVLTASGGPFRTWSREQLSGATPAQALKHPTWTMGAKVTIDSASLMNKALELIEAHWLFGLGHDRLGAVVHPQSMVHAFVECRDGSVLSQLSPPDMRLPIQCALCWPDRHPGPARRVDFSALGSLTFEDVDHTRFPAVLLAGEVLQAGGTSGAVLNAANEVAVEAFLSGRIPFTAIAAIVSDTLESMQVHDACSLGAVLDADGAARAQATSLLPS